jgi:hypothetical protein
MRLGCHVVAGGQGSQQLDGQPGRLTLCYAQQRDVT